MTMPRNVKIVDLMMAIPVSETNQEWYRQFAPLYAHHALVFVREDLDELRSHLAPVLENPLTARAGGCLHMLLDQALKRLDVSGIFQWLQIDTGLITQDAGEFAGLIAVDLAVDPHPGVVDEHVEAAVPFRDAVDERGDLIGVAHVRRDELDVLRERAGFRCGTTAYDDARGVGGETFGDAASDAATPTGDQDDLAREVERRHGWMRLMSRGKSVVSRTLLASTRRAIHRSHPIANPPWGGIQCLNASR
jgi:hypothetical protein